MLVANVGSTGISVNGKSEKKVDGEENGGGSFGCCCAQVSVPAMSLSLAEAIRDADVTKLDGAKEEGAKEVKFG